MSRKSAGLFLHTPVGVSLPMNTKKGRALLPILKTALCREEPRIAPLQVDGSRKATPTSVPASAKLPLSSLTDLMASKKELLNPVRGISGAQPAKDSNRTNFVAVPRKTMTFVLGKHYAFTRFLPSFYASNAPNLSSN